MPLQAVCVISLMSGKEKGDKGLAARQAAYADIEKAFSSIDAKLTKLELETANHQDLEILCNADVAIVDISIPDQRSALLRHTKLRKNVHSETVILVNDINPKFTVFAKQSYGNTAFIPYKMDGDGKCVVLDPVGEGSGVKSLEKPSSLLYQLKKWLKQVETTNRTNIKEKFLADLRKTRETFKGTELAKELASMRRRMDDPQLLSSDIVLNMLLSYREIQDYKAMVKLVEEIDSIKMNRITGTMAIQHLLFFALDRGNMFGESDKTLALKQNEWFYKSDNPIPESLVGKIYEDKFVESGYLDQDALDHAIECYQKAFDVQPNEYIGINLATLLVISGMQFQASVELQQIASSVNSLIEKKGNLSTLNDCASYLRINVITQFYDKAVQACEGIMHLDPPTWFLSATLANLRLTSSFRKEEGQIENKRDIELYEFWIDFFTKATNSSPSDLIPVLIKNQKLYLPSYIQINKEEEGMEFINIWHVAPPEDDKNHEWKFGTSSCEVHILDEYGKLFSFKVPGDSCDFIISFPAFEWGHRLSIKVLEVKNKLKKQRTSEVGVEVTKKHKKATSC